MSHFGPWVFPLQRDLLKIIEFIEPVVFWGNEAKLNLVWISLRTYFTGNTLWFTFLSFSLSEAINPVITSFMEKSLLFSNFPSHDFKVDEN